MVMSPHHIVAVLFPAWGHTTSFLCVAMQMMQKDPNLVMTLFQHNIMEAVLQTCEYDRTRLRVVGFGDKHIPFGPGVIKEAIGQLAGGWMENLPHLVKGSTGWPTPHALHMDFMIGGFVIEHTKRLVDPACKILAWWSCSLTSLPAHLTDYDFAAIAREIHSDAARRQDRSLDDILNAVTVAWNGSDSLSGRVVKHPGVPDISLFFPVATSELVKALVDTLLTIESPFPFLFALGGKLASLPQELIQRVNASGKGLVCDFWVEQRAILRHGTVGWFLTHGGFNSVSESLSQGIPLIMWPTTAEQPVNATLLSSGANPVAFELVRTGSQLGPSLRSDTIITGTVKDASAEFNATFAAVRGPEGARLRVAGNARQMGKALREARAGEASEELIRLARF
ncbi:hypothetical protein B0H17DRAFT_1195811 [Mycena rosella]|uniref:Glycosyltransferase n=1 Tax=Mycena rosella TaxID=1033263 RepID=A0AAD7DX91_MYCRO|nr:hypothetical protein B0H17DRAFT_1195811 [Mycena rosella]